MPKIINKTEEEIKKMKKVKKAARNVSSNKLKYARNKDIIKNNPEGVRKCKTCESVLMNKNFYASDMYNCKSCFKEKVNERRT